MCTLGPYQGPVRDQMCTLGPLQGHPSEHLCALELVVHALPLPRRRTFPAGGGPTPGHRAARRGGPLGPEPAGPSRRDGKRQDERRGLGPGEAAAPPPPPYAPPTISVPALPPVPP